MVKARLPTLLQFPRRSCLHPWLPKSRLQGRTQIQTLLRGLSTSTRGSTRGIQFPAWGAGMEVLWATERKQNTSTLREHADTSPKPFALELP